jgi:hypothetical protein
MNFLPQSAELGDLVLQDPNLYCNTISFCSEDFSKPFLMAGPEGFSFDLPTCSLKDSYRYVKRELRNCLQANGWIGREKISFLIDSNTVGVMWVTKEGNLLFNLEYAIPITKTAFEYLLLLRLNGCQIT